MTDKDIIKLASKLTKSLATKDDILEIKGDIKELATKEDIKGVKVDIKRLEKKIDEVDKKVSNVDKKLSKKIDSVDKKASSILDFAEGVDETATDHESRLKKIESIPAIAHQIKK